MPRKRTTEEVVLEPLRRLDPDTTSRLLIEWKRRNRKAREALEALALEHEKGLGEYRFVVKDQKLREVQRVEGSDQYPIVVVSEWRGIEWALSAKTVADLLKLS